MRNGDTKQVISFDGFELDAERRRLTREGKPLHLNAKAFDVLVYLAENAGRTVTKDELLEAVWENQFVEEGNLKVQMSARRKVLGEQKDDHRFLVTIPGKGYKFVADIRNGDREIVIESHRISRVIVDEEISEPAGNASAGEKRHLSMNRLYFAAGALALLSMMAGGIFWFSVRAQNDNALVPTTAADDQMKIKRLTSRGNVAYAALSPDGKFFAYSMRERGAYRSSLWLGQTSGNSDSQILPVADFSYYPRSFSADGNWLYYTASEPRGFDKAALYKIQVLGGVPQKILSGIGVYAAVSPDEKQVAFVRGNREHKTSILVVANLDGSGERELAVHPAEGSLISPSLAWSADGALIAFGADGRHKDSQEIFTANVANGTVTQLTSLDWTGLARVEWRRDGSGLLALARSKSSIVDRQVWQIDYPSGKAKKITGDLQQYGSSLSLSADSNSLLTVQSLIESQIWLAPAEDLAAARQITFSSAGLDGWHGIDWTEGGVIIYTARTDESLTLWSMGADGSNPVQITSAGFMDRRPSVTADGKLIVFQSNRSGEMEIWRVNSDGSDLRQLTFGGGSSVPHAAPDGRTVVYTRDVNGANTAWRVPIDGGEPTQIADAKCSNARVSPDGNLIACGTSENGKAKLAIVPLTGGAPVELFDVPPAYNFEGSIRWACDGRSVAYRDWVNGVWQQPLTGGEPKRLPGLPAEKLVHFEWSPDGKHFAYTRGRVSRDVVMISNLGSF